MTVGIATLTRGSTNYGGVLQAYALQEFLRAHEFDAFLLNTDSSCACRIPRTGWTRALRHPIRTWQLRRRIKAFADFFSVRFVADSNGCRSYEEFVNRPTVCDAYVAGSDQVWGMMKGKGVADYFFLGFAPLGAKRISYSASAGSVALSDETFAVWEKRLCHFNRICVREHGLCDFLRSHGINARWTCDPVLLQTRDFWSRLADSAERITDGDSAFCGFLRWDTVLDRSAAVEELFRSRDIKVQFPFAEDVGAILRGESISPTPEQWVNEIRNACEVLTNSFHCTVFSILFHRPFVILPLDGRHRASNDRILSLCERLGLQDRIADDITTLKIKMAAPIDWTAVDSRIEAWRNESSSTLIDALRNG